MPQDIGRISHRPPARPAALVIGGGPAGSAASILLAEAGHAVTLLERKESAHDKVCGEFISAEAAHYLHRLGIDLPRLGARPIRRLRLYSGGRMLEATLPFPAWSLSRRLLDEALIQEARRRGAAVRRGETVTGLSRGEAGWSAGTARGAVWRAPCVFLASGKHDLRDWRRPRRGVPDLIGLKMHLRLAARQRDELRGSVEISWFDGGYAGLEPVEDGVTTLCLLVGKEIYGACGGSWPALLAWLAGAAPRLGERLAGAVSLWPRPLAIYRVPYGYLHGPKAEAPGLFRLGDQMAVIPSFAGGGIAIALHSAFLGAGACLAGAPPALYYRQARDSLRHPLRAARLLESLVSRPRGREAAFLLARLPGLLAAAIDRTRLDPADCSGTRCGGSGKS